MAYLYNFPNDTTGIDSTLIEVAKEVPAFPIMFLIMIWGFIVFGGMAGQLKRSGYVDAPMWFTLGFFSTTILSLIMSLTAGMINPIVLSVSVAGTILCGLWLFLSAGRFES